MTARPEDSLSPSCSRLVRWRKGVFNYANARLSLTREDYVARRFRDELILSIVALAIFHGGCNRIYCYYIARTSYTSRPQIEAVNFCALLSSVFISSLSQIFASFAFSSRKDERFRPAPHANRFPVAVSRSARTSARSPSLAFMAFGRAMN